MSIHIPPGTLAEPATLSISEADDEDGAPSPLEAALPVGQAIEIDLGDADLLKPITIEFAYDADTLPDGATVDDIFLAYYDEDVDDWIPVTGEIDSERRVVVVQTDHLSWWNPFTWNWDAWIAVLNNVLTLNVTDFIQAVQLLTDECRREANGVSADMSAANSVVQGCIEGDSPVDPTVRVVNLKSFFVELSATGGNTFFPEGVLGPGESWRTDLPTSQSPPYLVRAEITQQAGWYLIVHLIIQMLPGLNQVGIQGPQIACITERVADVSHLVAAVESLIREHDGAAAAEDLTRFLLDEEGIGRFITAADDCFYGPAATWSVEGIRQIGAATATIMSATDFVANYLLNYSSQVSFNWTRPTPTPTPTSTPAPVAIVGSGGTEEARRVALQLCLDDFPANGFVQTSNGHFEGTVMLILSGVPRTFQVKDITVGDVIIDPLTPFDHANGITWRGTVFIERFSRYRLETGNWTEWQTGSPFFVIEKRGAVWTRSSPLPPPYDQMGCTAWSSGIGVP